ncbi:MAG: class I SAM-dependent methyltransferase, partial [Candidatus Kariarchaeaceae archaeon]
MTWNSASTSRFSNRVDNYVKYRPSYPREIIPFLQKAIHLQVDHLIADIGSGTGKLTELFLEFGNTVIGVEPNMEMREAGDEYLQKFGSKFTSLVGTAEHTGLGNQSVDLIIAGQAFHWFEPEPSRIEFKRILKPQGWVCLVWNSRRTGGNPFLDAYEQLLMDFASDYPQVSQSYVLEGKIEGFLKEDSVIKGEFYLYQEFDLESLKGRALSSSYVPTVDHKDYNAFMARLDAIFHQHNEN